MADHRKRWFTQIIQSALDEDLVSPRKVLAHVTPEVMANHLPPALMSEILARSLSAGAMRPELVLATLTPELLADHVPHQILWECLAEAGSEAGMEDGSGGVGPLRRFLEAAIASGLDYGMVSEDEVLVELTPEILAEYLPISLKAILLRACFEAEKVDPELVVRSLGVAALAEHTPIPELWKIVSAAGARAAGIRDLDGKVPETFSIPAVTAPREPEPEPPAFDDVTRNTVPADNDGIEVAADSMDDDRRKPNRRITGAGATSRRRSRRESVLPGTAPHRASTEPGDIEVVEETDVRIPPGSNGSK